MKKWYKSKTVWVNGLTAALGFITYVLGTNLLPVEVTAVVAGLVVPVVNVVLRFLTKEEITVKG